jgi:rhodanese-related sulfurtransferase
MRACLAAVLCVVAACDRGAPGPGAGWSRVEPAAFARELSRPAFGARPPLVIVDVREPELFRKSHLPGAINIPYPAAKERAAAELARSTDIVLVCHAGPMGDEIAAILARRGFPHVRNLAGGMKRWRGPIESGP